jgi:hypothetical protein
MLRVPSFDETQALRDREGILLVLRVPGLDREGSGEGGGGTEGAAHPDPSLLRRRDGKAPLGSRYVPRDPLADSRAPNGSSGR